ncbi:polymeric immunoglobulin receptor [Chanodichthys erythropterus]|uniref:polymeric immunoglobulin receptor n=1 Tax=Chanodichthys erythropterus TaxID=933992 RepID=UPI00351DD587
MDLDCLLLLCIFMNLSGAQDVTTVRKISVQKGQSVIIPCLYEQKYAFSYKYLSAGGIWFLSNDIKSFDQRYHHKKVSISDDSSRNIYTVRFDDVQESAQYWCAVHIPSGFDKHAGFFLDVTAGLPSLYVNRQNVSGSENGSVTVTCYHHGQSDVKWCKFADRCVTGMFGTLDGASVEIRSDQKHMTVTMSGLKKENTGWYSCSTNDQQMPVHITVHHTQALVTAEMDRITLTARKRTAIFFLLPVVLEILLIIIIYSALKLLTFCKERCLTSVNEEESQYITMHRSRSSSSYGGTSGEGPYEIMAELKRNTELSASGHKSTSPTLAKKSDLSNMPQRESDYVNIRQT